MSFAFWCSKCKVDHAGECPTPAKVVRTFPSHDWVPHAVVDLTLNFHCSQCALEASISAVKAVQAPKGSKPEDLLPQGPCYPDLDDLKRAYLDAKKQLFVYLDSQGKTNPMPAGAPIGYGNVTIGPFKSGNASPPSDPGDDDLGDDFT